MKIFLYNSSRKSNTDEGTNTERKNAKKQVWMRKTEQLQIGEVDQSREDGCHMASQVSGLSQTLADLEFIRLEDELNEERMVTPGIETGPRIVHIDRGSS